MAFNFPQIALVLFTLCITLFANSSLSALTWNPILDFCVADLQASPINNRFPCKSHVTSDDFFYSGLNTPLDTANPRGLAANAADLLTFPGLNTMGISMYNVAINAGVVNPPHSHLGATEAGFILEGEVLIGFLTTNNTLFQKVVGPGDMFVIPPGLNHYEANVGKTKGRFLAVVTTDLPSEVIIPNTLFLAKPAIPDEVLMSVFKTDRKTINKFRSKFTPI